MEHDSARVLPCLTVDRDFSRLDQCPGRIYQSYCAVRISNDLVGSQSRTHSKRLGQSVRHHSRCEQDGAVSSRLAHRKTHEISAVEVQSGLLSRSQDDGSRFRYDGPFVQHGRTSEYGVAAVGDSDTTLIDDCPEVGSGQSEIVVAAQEVLITYIERRCDQSTHVYSGARAKQDSVGIDEPDVPVGFERPENG